MYDPMFMHCLIEVTVDRGADLNTQEVHGIYQYLSLAVKINMTENRMKPTLSAKCRVIEC
jgi:hypothetical protein